MPAASTRADVPSVITVADPAEALLTGRQWCGNTSPVGWLSWLGTSRRSLRAGLFVGRLRGLRGPQSIGGPQPPRPGKRKCLGITAHQTENCGPRFDKSNDLIRIGDEE